MIKYIFLIIIFTILYTLIGVLIEEKQYVLMAGFWLGYLLHIIITVIKEEE